MKEENNKHLFFRERLLDWYEENQRSFPWKETSDPYKIWLSEIILQQTRTDQGLPYYLRISEKYPTVFQLAAVDDDEFMNDWQGLGYYSRARNMLSSARWIINENNGIFPDDYNGLLQLKGVGDYTASAIASFAFNHAHAVVDGNVIRVIARYFGIDDPVDLLQTRKLINRLADDLLDKNLPAVYNQAIMDFGATQCKPKKVNCISCPLQIECVAFDRKLVPYIPIKSKKIIRKHRYFHFMLIKTNNENYVVEKRMEADIWQGLFQFPMIETQDEDLNINELVQIISTQYKIDVDCPKLNFESTQHLTHQTIHGKFYEFNNSVDDSSINTSNGLKNCNDLSSIALPKILSAYVLKFII